MLFFLSVVIINGLQLKLQPFDYQKGEVTDTAYSVSLQIAGSNYQMVIDNINPYSWLYSKNPANNNQCSNCPQAVQQFDCKETQGCEKLQNSEPITLSNTNKCILAKNTVMLDQRSFDNFQLCLSYDISNQQYKQNGVLSLTKLTESPNQSNLFYQLEQHSLQQIYQISTSQGQERIFISEQSEYQLRKTITYQNQAQDQWKLQFQLFQKDIQFLKKEDNQFITFDLTTKYNYFTQDIIKKIISQIKNYQSLFCSIEDKRLMCLCSKPDFIDKIPKIKIAFNGLPNTYFLPLNPKFLQNEQKCQLDIFQHSTSSFLGNQFFQQNGAIFNSKDNTILIGQSNQDTEDPFSFSNPTLYCLLASFLMLFGLLSLIFILNKISQEQLSKPKYEQPQPKPLYVVSNHLNKFKPYNLELSTNQKMIYSRG
ncbi:unnamed protein product [Paramecium octaurelia]|uniref:Transmembrane protein n=1 Tax=Paramecium octaurelia TaxID=43137 RepID=A0A8S1RW25_PAROT|nr:unnamed protein product [Paramecium octaurelia]